MSFGDDTLDPANTAVAEPGTQSNWFRALRHERLEVCLRARNADGVMVKLRASGPTEQMWQVVAMFEDMTGCAVDGTWLRPPRSGARPLEGQLTITEALESNGNGEE